MFKNPALTKIVGSFRVLKVVISNAYLLSLTLVVAEKSVKSTGDVVKSHESEVILVELKCHWELVMNLMDNVQELEENRSETRVLVWVGQVTSVVESVT